MDWVIYVPESAAKNFEIGLRNKIWGHKKIFKTVRTDRVADGDTLYFVEHLRLMRRDDGSSIPGFPRVGAEHYNGVITSFTKCEITSTMFEDDSRVWPDDIYPFRYNIKLIDQKFNIPFGQEFFSSEFVDAVQQSTLRKGLAIDIVNPDNTIFTAPDKIDLEITEGAPVYRRHLSRERNPEIIRLKKREAKAVHGKLSCEACDFNFYEVYGDRGLDYIECHHTNPLSDTKGNQKTSLKDLSLLCSNCHRIIHRSRPWISIAELKGKINE